MCWPQLVSAMSPDGCFPIRFPASRSESESFEAACPNAACATPSPGGLSPLHYAARDNKTEAARILLEAGADLEQKDPNDITPLLMAIGNNQLEAAHFLIEAGANVNVSDWYGRTPLWQAVEVRNMDFDNGTLLNYVDREPVVELIHVLLEAGADPNSRSKEAMPIRKHMLRITGTLAWVDFVGQTPFITASLSGDLTVMRTLLEYGADPHIATPRRDNGPDGRGGRQLGRGPDL